jgi:hypothetical protein
MSTYQDKRTESPAPSTATLSAPPQVTHLVHHTYLVGGAGGDTLRVPYQLLYVWCIQGSSKYLVPHHYPTATL